MAIERTTNCDESCSSQFGITWNNVTVIVDEAGDEADYGAYDDEDWDGDLDES